MGKNITKMIVFCSGLLVIFWCLGFIVKPTAKDQDTGMADVVLRGVTYEKENTLDVVFLGDSVVYSSTIPLQIWKQYGITSYVSAAPGQGLDSTLNQLELILEKQKPKIIFYEMNNFFTPISRVNYAVEQIQDIFPFFRYHNRWKISERKSPYDFNMILTGKGYHFADRENPADTTNYKKETTRLEWTSSENVWLFNQMVELCKKYNVELILYSIPSVKNWNYAKHNRVVELSKEYGLTYIDLNLLDEVTIDWNRDTYDQGDHLNYFGAVQVTKYLGNYLNNKGIFIDKRSLNEYIQWNDALESVFYMKKPPIR